MTSQEIVKRLRKINNFLELSNEEIAEFAGETSKGYENAVKVGKISADILLLIKDIEKE